MIRHRFRVYKHENTKAGTIYPLQDETGGVWTHGRVLGTSLAVYDMPYAMPKSEEEAWSWLPKDIEIAPTEMVLAHIQFIYIRPNNDWTCSFCVEPESVRAILDQVHTGKQGWAEFETFSRQIMLINLAEIIRVNTWEDTPNYGD